jgi:hypothetical protein
MSEHDLLLQTIDAIYASGIDSDHMPKVLEEMSRLLGAVIALRSWFENLANSTCH